MIRYIMSITAKDRPGIVAGVSEAVLELQGNIEADSQTVHQGYFAMMMLCAFPDGADADRLVDLIHARTGADLHVYVTPYEPPSTAIAPDAQVFIITAIGADKPGMVHALTSFLASRQINIDDHYACRKQDDFIIVCQVSVPRSVDVFMLQADLDAVGQSGGFSVNMQHENIFVATNELRFGRMK